MFIMTVKDKESEVFSYFEKVKCEFLSRSHIISLFFEKVAF